MVAATPVGFEARQKDWPRFRPDGTFKVVQFTDLHMTPPSEAGTVNILESVLEAERPDFVAYTGDICEIDSGSCKDEARQSAAFHAAFGPSERRGIPWAITFGNWDRAPDANFTGAQSADFIQRSFNHSFNRQAPAGVQGDSVFDVPILLPGQDSYPYETSTAAVLYFMDTHANDGCEGVSGTGCIYPSEVAWYNATSAAYTRLNHGRPVPGFAFFHIALPEHITAWNEGTATYGRLDEPAGDHGLGICCVIDSSGFFEAAVANGDIKGMTCGHDHDNDFHGTYKGIEMMYGRKTGFGSYGPPSSWGSFPAKDGARVIEFHRDATSGDVSIATWIRLMDGTVLSETQEGIHRPGNRKQVRCNSVSAHDAQRHQCQDANAVVV